MTYRRKRWEVIVADFDCDGNEGKIIAGFYETRTGPGGMISKMVDRRDKLKFDYKSLPVPGEWFKYYEFWREDPCVPVITKILNDAYPGCNILWVW